MLVKLQYTNRPGEFAINPEAVLLVEPLVYTDKETEYEGSLIHLEGGKTVECGLDVDVVVETLAGTVE